MPKLKTRKAASKRYKVTGNHNFLRRHAFKGHLLMKKSNKTNRTLKSLTNNKLTLFSFIFFLCLGYFQTTQAEDNVTKDIRDQKIEQLESAVQKLMGEIKNLKEERKVEKTARLKQEENLSELKDQIEEIDTREGSIETSWINRFSLGGYGELHANFTQGSDKDVFDIHRLVVYLGYDFNKWIKFHSEIELEHAFVSDSHDGEMGFEQAYADFLINESFNIRIGRILTPLGIVNKKHEPPSFNGVERPSFAKYIIPSTWSADGIGIFGKLSPALKYEAYIVGGLDGSKFSAKNGIRSGRIKDRPSLNDISFTGRLDFFPLLSMQSGSTDHQLRTGLSMFYGGLDNGSNGSNPDIDGDILIYSGDFEYSFSNFDFRGAVAYEKIDGAQSIENGTASDIFGWYLETGYHFWPDKFKNGLLERSDAVAFIRYDDYDTQYKMPAGIEADPAGSRSEWTFGINFYPVPNFVIKADYQIRDDSTNQDLNDLINIGAGWQF